MRKLKVKYLYTSPGNNDGIEAEDIISVDINPVDESCIKDKIKKINYQSEYMSIKKILLIEEIKND